MHGHTHTCSRRVAILLVVELFFSPSQHDQVEGARRMKLSTIIVVGVVIAFIIGIGCTDRPAVPKAMQS